MATTFDVFYLGTGPLIDLVEGDQNSDNAAALLGTTFGSVADPLVDHIHSLSPGTAGFAAGVANAYDTDNNTANDQFRIDGGADQTTDGSTIYNATITYLDGTTATITATVMQDTAGNLYMLPETSYNTDQTALEALPIRSVTLDSISSSNMFSYADRYSATYAVCFTSGTLIRTPAGQALIDDLRVGDLVTTMDNGPQAIRWIGRQHIGQAGLLMAPDLRPVLIPAGRMGNARNLLVSPQHGLLIGQDHLVRAIHAARARASGIRIAHGRRSVTYIHLMFDAHQIIFAEGVPSESFFPGPMAQNLLNPQALRELRSLFPDVFPLRPARPGIIRAYGDTARAFLSGPMVEGALAR